MPEDESRKPDLDGVDIDQFLRGEMSQDSQTRGLAEGQPDPTEREPSFWRATGSNDDPLGSRLLPEFPKYETVREIDDGGQGHVYEAIHKVTKRKVAIKVMREGHFASDRSQARFDLEMEVLGRLNHPGIVGIHTNGVTSDGRFYFVMDYVPGVRLDDWTKAKDRSIEEALTLFGKICEAVNAAHLRGVIHRDLKPGNILIDYEDGPHIVDFGLAKIAGGVSLLDTTEPGEFRGTPRWASPEQAEAIPDKIDLRTDVYSLGLVLYHMLTGALPYPDTFDRSELLRWIINTPPIRPSVACPRIKGDLESIILKCLEKDRKNRYQTAGELGQDIARYLGGEPIARDQSRVLPILIDRLRRYKQWLAVAAVFALVLTTALSASLTLLRQARKAEATATAAKDSERRQRLIADQQRTIAQQQERAAQVALAEAAREEGTALHLAGRGQESRDAFSRARDAFTRLNMPTLPAEIGIYNSLRDFGAPIGTLRGHTDGLLAVAWLPDGVRACSASEDGTIKLWDARSGRALRTFVGHDGAVTSIAVSPNGRLLLSGGSDQTVRLWNAETGDEIRPGGKLPWREPSGHVRGVAFSPDGRLALSAPGEPGGAVRLLDVETGELVRSFQPPDDQEHSFYCVTFSPDGERILATTYERNIWMWDRRTGQVRREFRGHTGYVISAAFSPDGTRVLSASYDQTLKLWDADTGERLRTMQGHTAGARGVAFVGRGEKAMSCSMDGTLKLWDVATGGLLRTFAGHVGGIRGLAVSPDAQRAVSAGIDHTLKVWDLNAGVEAPTVHLDGTVSALGCASDGTTFVCGDATGLASLYDLATFRRLRTFTGLTWPLDTVAILPGGRLLAADSAGAYRVWTTSDGRELSAGTGPGPGENRYIRGGKWCFTAVSRDGVLAICSRPDNAVDVRRVDSGATIWSLPAGEHRITSVAFSPDARSALIGDESGRFHHWDLERRQCLFSSDVGTKPGGVDCLSFSADGALALTGGHDLVVRLWDLKTRHKLREFAGHTLIVRGAGFGFAQRAVFSCGGDQTLRVWDLEAGSELGLAVQFPDYAYALCVIPPGDAILCGTGSEAGFWDLSRLRRYLEFEPRVKAAREAIQADAPDAGAMATLGEWYAFRGVNDWAVPLLLQARAAGAAVSSLTLARCLWQLEQLDGAAAEYREALARGEAPAEYLSLCADAVRAEAERRRSATSSSPMAESSSH